MTVIFSLVVDVGSELLQMLVPVWRSIGPS